MTTGGAPVAVYDKAYSSGSVLRTPDGQAYISLNDSKSNDYIILDGQGRTIAAGAGTATAAKDTALFQVKSNRFFGYMDTSGRYVFRLSLLGDLPD